MTVSVDFSIAREQLRQKEIEYELAQEEINKLASMVRLFGFVEFKAPKESTVATVTTKLPVDPVNIRCIDFGAKRRSVRLKKLIKKLESEI